MHLPITLAPRPSRALAAAMALSHGAAGAALVPTALPMPAKLALLLALGLSLGLSRRRRPQATLTLQADGRVAVGAPGHEGIRGDVLPATTVLPWLVVLLVRLAGTVRVMPLPADALAADEHRQLRLWLRWRAKGGEA